MNRSRTLHTIDPDALYKHAFSMHQAGNLSEAISLYQQLLNQFPNETHVLNLLASACLQSESFDEAIQILEKSLMIDPNQPMVLSNLGYGFHKHKRFAEAIVHCDRAIALDPDFADAHNNRGVVLKELNRFQEALESYWNAIRLKPDFADAYNNRGVVLKELNRFQEALESYCDAITLKPGFADAHNNKGAVLCELRRFDEALISYDCAIHLYPDFAEAIFNRAVLLNKLQRFDEALMGYNDVIHLKPDFADPYFDRGIILFKSKRFEEALENFDYAIELKPDFADAYNNRGVILKELNRFVDALASCDEASILKPDFADAHWNRAFLKLSLGDYKEGWRLYEWRWKTLLKGFERAFDEPLWLGEVPLSGKTILIYAEQGFGDVIQMCRYLPMLNALGADVILEVRSQLIPLLSTLKGSIKFVEIGMELPIFDFQCPIMSLPLAFKTTVESIPADVTYLFSEHDKQKEWRHRLGEKTKKRIGIAYSGLIDHLNDKNRSMQFDSLKPLLNLPFEFHILQKEIRAEDMAVLTEFPHVKIHHENLLDFADTAALVNEMDLVISVDTSVAHLAGALGKPVWVLLSWVPDFRWLLDRTDSPWYPTARLFRQPELGNWERVIEDVCQKLKDLMNIQDSDLNITDPDALYRNAFSMHQAGNARDAVPLYQQLHTQFPDNAEILTLLGTAYLELENIPEGIRLLEHSLKISANQPVALSNLANGLYKLGRFEEALILCERAIVLAPDFSDAYNNHSNILVKLKQFSNALISCDIAINFNPDSAEAYNRPAA